MYDESAAHAIAEHVLKRSPADQTEVVHIAMENLELPVATPPSTCRY